MAAKHQSMFETFALLPLLAYPDLRDEERAPVDPALRALHGRDRHDPRRPRQGRGRAPRARRARPARSSPRIARSSSSRKGRAGRRARRPTTRPASRSSTGRSTCRWCRSRSIPVSTGRGGNSCAIPAPSSSSSCRRSRPGSAPRNSSTGSKRRSSTPPTGFSSRRTRPGRGRPFRRGNAQGSRRSRQNERRPMPSRATGIFREARRRASRGRILKPERVKMAGRVDRRSRRLSPERPWPSRTWASSCSGDSPPAYCSMAAIDEIGERLHRRPLRACRGGRSSTPRDRQGDQLPLAEIGDHLIALLRRPRERRRRGTSRRDRARAPGPGRSRVPRWTQE